MIMSFTLDKELMRKTFSMGDEGDSFTHKQAQRIKLFPYIGNNNVTIVKSLSVVAAEWLRLIREQNNVCETSEKTLKKITDRVDVAPGLREEFAQIIKTLYWDENGNIRPNSIESMCYIPCNDPSELRTAQYLCSVLGNHCTLKMLINNAVQTAAIQGNVLEKTVLDALKADSQTNVSREVYYTIHMAPHKTFADDLKYVLENSSRTKDYLVELLEFYYFFYTAQTSLCLQAFEYGDRHKVFPLYFSLDWEKTNKARECYTSGWQMLQRAVQGLFCHAITLEILNQNPTEDRYDYIALKEYIEQNNCEAEIAAEIKDLCDMYRKAIKHGAQSSERIALDAIVKHEEEHGPAFAEVRYLFDSIRVQFENSQRGRVNSAYNKNFEDFCKDKYLKYRGQSGLMLNLTEEHIIFLTKLAIKHEEQISLNEVFRQFELRGVFLDQPSKNELITFYTKLNLIDKKSDSGDAQYVKRIL